jgi:hypothetical protein
LIDNFGHVVLITRKHNPALTLRHCLAVLWTLFKGLTWQSLLKKRATAALREATEETGNSKRPLEEAQVTPLGHLSYDRPLDIRVALGDIGGRYYKGRLICGIDPGLLRQNSTRPIASAPEVR